MPVIALLRENPEVGLYVLPLLGGLWEGADTPPVSIHPKSTQEMSPGWAVRLWPHQTIQFCSISALSHHTQNLPVLRSPTHVYLNIQTPKRGTRGCGGSQGKTGSICLEVLRSDWSQSDTPHRRREWQSPGKRHRLGGCRQPFLLSTVGLRRETSSCGPQAHR